VSDSTFVPGREASIAAPLPVRVDINQQLRLRRFYLASAFSLLYLTTLTVFYTQDRVDGATLVGASLVVVALIATFYGLFRSGVNLRFSDPSLTIPQVLAAIFTMLAVAYRAPETRVVFTAFFFVALMFGMLRASALQLSIVGAVSLAGFALVAGLRYWGSRDVEMLRVDLLQVVVTLITFPFLVFIGTRVRRLHEADRRKDDFLATLAHELRNPLAPIRTGIEILRMTAAHESPTPVLPMMERQFEHLTRLLDDLLDVSRITRGKVALRVEAIDLRHSIEAALEASRPLIVQLNHELVVSMPPAPVPVDGDPVRLAQIFSNLFNNAAKYTPPGGRITLTVERHGDMAEVKVGDTGIGIPRDRLQEIFEMFTQIPNPSTHAQGGLGIGLALVKGLVALHGGSVQASSDGMGRGSEFRVRLPIRLTASPAAPSAGPPEESTANLRIVVVDDNQDAAASLSMLLQLLGHDVRVAYDGESAVHTAEAFRPQAMLLDLGMPGMSGYDTCRRVRTQAWGNEITILAVTGWGQEEDRRNSAAAGFDGHLVKPVDPDMLINTLTALRASR
jgi:signal transduction histidine kinase/CheY-like chemotaxis protein